MRTAAAPGALLAAAALLAACSAPNPDDGFASDAPGADIAAIGKAARESDHSQIPELIRCLESDDPAVRWAASGALRKLTGETYGYDHAAPWADREAAIERWRRAYPPAASGTIPAKHEGPGR